MLYDLTSRIVERVDDLKESFEFLTCSILEHIHRSSTGLHDLFYDILSKKCTEMSSNELRCHADATSRIETLSDVYCLERFPRLKKHSKNGDILISLRNMHEKTSQSTLTL